MGFHPPLSTNARRSLAALCALAVVVAAAGCSARPRYDLLAAESNKSKEEEFNRTIALMAGEAATSDAEYVIGPEDLLEVTLFDLENGDGEPRVVDARVATSGYLTLPYVGKVMAGGLTPLQFEEELRTAYRRFIREPQLSVLVKEYKSYTVSVIGYVTTPGVLELRGRRTLLEAVALSGGLAEGAGRSVRLTRATPEGLQTVLVDLDRIAEQGDLTLNLALLPNDVLSVPKAGMFYVEGVVKNPGAYPLLDKTNVSQAVATAGGADRALANMGGTVLYRRLDSGERIAIPINLARLQTTPSEDLAIQAEDVIVVPISGPRMVWDRFTGGILRVGLSAGSL